MLPSLSRLLRQTKSALKAPGVIAIGYATCIEMLTIATLMIRSYSYYSTVLVYLINGDVVTGFY